MAKVSVSTVSYALRSDPRIPVSTAQYIRKIADRLGYRPHPSIAMLMAHIQASRIPKFADKIAFVSIEGPTSDLNDTFRRRCIEGARKRARELGYALEEFCLSVDGMTPRRLDGILKARGIHGIVFSGCQCKTAVTLDMDWNAYATAIIGNARWTPELHRAGHYHYMGMRRIMLELQARGYRRPAALLEDVINERASRTWEAAFYAYHPSFAARTALFKTLDGDPCPIKDWLRRCKPDALILSSSYLVETVRKILGRANSAIGVAILSLDDRMAKIAGVDPCHDRVAANAFDLVIGQIRRNETGVPREPKELLFDGQWVEGASLRSRVHALPEFALCDLTTDLGAD